MDIQNGSTNLESIRVPNNQFTEARTSCANGPQVKDLGSAAEEHHLKVRKPYTITKQRERWTDEEHNKFLEALKLYGRAWRRIEEHIGTKTAVQIRSHAQKFFTKVTRESAGNNASILRTIAIPPPRPKRKPIHPYPRKLGQTSSKEFPVLEQPQQSSSPSASEQENRSPTSVLSPLDLHIKGPLVWNGPNNCTSPLSSSSGSSAVGALNDQENGCQSSTASAERSGCLSSALASTGMTTQDRPIMEGDVGSENDISSNSGSSLEGTSLKLFGRIVLVTDKQKPSSSDWGNSVACCKSLPVDDVHRSMEVDSQARMESIKHTSHGALLDGAAQSSWNPWPASVPSMLYCLPFHRDIANPGEPPILTLPLWWPHYGPFIGPQSINSPEELHHPSAEASGEVVKKVAQVGSNTYSIIRMMPGGQKGRAFDSLSADQSKDKETSPALQLRPSENSAFRIHKASPDKCIRGFVPYRRCVAGKEVQHAATANEDVDGIRVELCL